MFKIIYYFNNRRFINRGQVYRLALFLFAIDKTTIWDYDVDVILLRLQAITLF